MAAEFKAEDLLLYKTISDIHCTSTSENVACIVRCIDKEKDVNRNQLWIVPFNGAIPWQMPDRGRSVRKPRWAPDREEIAVLMRADKSDFTQIFLLHVDGREEQQISRLDADVTLFEWSPCGKKMLAICSLQNPQENLGAPKVTKSDKITRHNVKRIWRLPYKKDGKGYALDTEKHLFSIDVHSGQHVQLTEGAFNVRHASWCPDGKKIAYSRTREARLAHRTDIWIMDVSTKTQQQISVNVASADNPKWSSDGRYIVFMGSEAEGDAQKRLWCFNTETNILKPLGDDSIDVVIAENIHWAEDSSAVVLILACNGKQGVARVEIESGRVELLICSEHQVTALNVTKEHLVLVSEDPLSPNELYLAKIDGKEQRQLTHFNAWWHERTLPNLQSRRFDVPDNKAGTTPIEGWLLLPRNTKGPFPLLLDVHGGPASYALLQYNSHPYWPVLVSRGWAVLALNPIGSSSFGRDCVSQLRGHWGTLDLAQHLAAVDILVKEGITDDRLAIRGKSYGGYLSAWAIGHSHRFRAAVVSAPITNIESHFGTSDSGYYTDAHTMRGDPRQQPERMRELSPVHYAKNVRTPTLILQGEADERCPKGQSEELFVAIMCSGDTPCEMVLYPQSDHHFFEQGRPSYRVDATVRLIDWLERWIDVECPAS